MRERQPCVYVLASGKHGTLYIGVTSNLLARLYQHRHGLISRSDSALSQHLHTQPVIPAKGFPIEVILRWGPKAGIHNHDGQEKSRKRSDYGFPHPRE